MASGSLLYVTGSPKPVLCDNPEWLDGEGGGRGVQEGGDIWPIRVDVWQKPSQYCKVIIPLIKNKKIFKEFI